MLQGGATIEIPVDAQILKANGELSFLLNEASFTTAQRIAAAINRSAGWATAFVRNADEVAIIRPAAATLPAFVAAIENLRVQPDAATHRHQRAHRHRRRRRT